MEDNKFAAVGGIVLRGGCVLLVRHTYGSAAGKLLNPSGMLKQGELPHDALRREIMEEAGVEIEPKGLLAIRCSVKDWWMIFLANHVSGEPRPDNNETSEALFIPCDEALTRPDVTDATKELIRLAGEGRVMRVNERYAAFPSSDGRVMYSV